jgi:hypothetical protein
MVLDTEKLTIDIKSAASIILDRDVTSVEGFDTKLVSRIARQADTAATNMKRGVVTKETRDFLIDCIRSSTSAFVGGLKGVDAFTSGKVNYAIVYVVFKTITNATGAELKA